MRRWIPQHRWVEQRLERIPGTIADILRAEHAGRIGIPSEHSTSPLFVANQQLAADSRTLLKAHIWNAFDDEEITSYAENYAHRCQGIATLTGREEFALGVGVAPPPARYLSDRYEARAARLADPHWWRRQLRKAWTRSSENAVRCLGVIRKGRAPYCTDQAVSYRRAQKRRLRRFQENTVAVNELGEQLSLFDVAQKSIANPALRRGEFMTRVRGFEELAEYAKHEAIFFTLTCPSRFHARRIDGGTNPTFEHEKKTGGRDMVAVRAAQQWLCKQWARARAKLHRKSVVIYGFRIAEPHHDATPHWHGLVFVRPDEVDIVRDILRWAFLESDSPNEAGAREHRVKLVHIEKSMGSAAGYIAKYVSKNIDGHGKIGAEQSDETGEEVIDGIDRVDAWASLHGIRQFQQLGGPPVGIWREARRLRDQPSLDVDIERVRAAADRGDWRGYCLAQTWQAGRRHCTVTLWKETTGELTRYGELRAPGITGLQCTSRRVITRPHSWQICRKGRVRPIGRALLETTAIVKAGSPSMSSVRGDRFSPSVSGSSLGPVAITVRRAPAGSVDLRYTSVIRGRRYQIQPGSNGAPPTWFLIDDAAGDARGARMEAA
jgi:hypothetical protein